MLGTWTHGAGWKAQTNPLSYGGTPENNWVSFGLCRACLASSKCLKNVKMRRAIHFLRLRFLKGQRRWWVQLSHCRGLYSFASTLPRFWLHPSLVRWFIRSFVHHRQCIETFECVYKDPRKTYNPLFPCLPFDLTLSRAWVRTHKNDRNFQSRYLNSLKLKRSEKMTSWPGDSVCRAVASNSIGPWFESSH